MDVFPSKLQSLSEYWDCLLLWFISFKKSATNLKGSGYTFLVLDKNGKLRIINMSNQDTPYYYGFIPIMTIDVWEHAYYLDYQNDRKNYLKNLFLIINWHIVSSRLP